MKQKTLFRYIIIAVCLTMVIVLFVLPVVKLYSYQWAMVDVVQKLPRLMGGTGGQLSAWVVMTGMVLSPLLVALTSLRGRAVGKYGLLSLFFFVGICVVALLSTSKPVSPGIAVWFYLALAIVATIAAKQNNSTFAS